MGRTHRTVVISTAIAMLAMAGCTTSSKKVPEVITPTGVEADGFIAVGKDLFGTISMTNDGDIGFIRKSLATDVGEFYLFRTKDRSTVELATSSFENGSILEGTITEKWAAWVDGAPDLRWRLFVRRLTGGKPLTVATSEDPGRQRLQFDIPQLVLDEDRLYWSEVNDQGADLYAFEIPSGEVRPLTNTHRVGIPMESKDHLVYPQFTSDDRTSVDIEMLNALTGKKETLFDQGAGIGSLSLAYPYLVFHNRDLELVQMMDVHSKAVRTLSDRSAIPYDDFLVAASDGWAAWTHVNDTAVHLYKESDGSQTVVSTGFDGVEVMRPILRRNQLAFIGQKQGEQRLFYKHLP
jgi:hypothetical protein